MKLLNLKDNYIKALEKKSVACMCMLMWKKETYKVKEKNDGEKNKISGKSITLKYFWECLQNWLCMFLLVLPTIGLAINIPHTSSWIQLCTLISQIMPAI